MIGNKILCLSLTGENSHKINIPPGQGSFSIGTKGISKGKYDIWVEEDHPIHWNAFNELFTPYGQQHMDKFPYGDWPRVFYYSGMDTGFVDWSLKRPIEEFHWSPHKNASVDLTKANIRRTFIYAENSKIEISIGDNIRELFLSGSLANIDIKKCSTIPYLHFSPVCSQTDTCPYQLPEYKALKKAVSVVISCSPAEQAFDCRSLLQFQNLTYLNLTGNLTNLDALAELEQLKSIGLRYVPDLTNMPKLRTWKNLKSFIGWNIEETAGKILRAELKELSKEKELDYTHVSKLRKAIWFTTEYGIPFSGWENGKAKIATKAYKTCLKEIKKAKTEPELHKAIAAFIEAINQLPELETPEREDVGTAVSQLIASSVLEISQKTGEEWFDELRNF